jgi:hypothetical protein
MNVKLLSEILRGRNNLGDVEVNERLIILIFKEIRCELIDWIQLTHVGPL